MTDPLHVVLIVVLCVALCLLADLQRVSEVKSTLAELINCLHIISFSCLKVILFYFF